MNTPKGLERLSKGFEVFREKREERQLEQAENRMVYAIDNYDDDSIWYYFSSDLGGIKRVKPEDAESHHGFVSVREEDQELIAEIGLSYIQVPYMGLLRGQEYVRRLTCHTGNLGQIDISGGHEMIVTDGAFYTAESLAELSKAEIKKTARDIANVLLAPLQPTQQDTHQTSSSTHTPTF